MMMILYLEILLVELCQILFFLENGILVKKSEPEIISDAKRYQRMEKLNKILKNKDIEIEEFDQKLYEDFIIKDGELRMKKWNRN